MRTLLTNHLLDYLHEDDEQRRLSPCSQATLLQHGMVAQEWLLKSYLDGWLKLLGGTVFCEYPLARRHAASIRGIERMRDALDPTLSTADQVFLLRGLEDALKGVAAFTGAPSQRSLQWGVWGREVPAALALAFEQSDDLSPVVCEAIAACCMYAAFLMSQIVTDSGTADEVGDSMFEQEPRVLLKLLDGLPEAPAA